MSDYDAFREQVMEWVRRRLMEDPGASDREMFAEAKKRWPELESLSYRQWQIRYPVQVKRALADQGGRIELVNGRERWSAPPGGEEAGKPAQREMFAREDGGA